MQFEEREAHLRHLEHCYNEMKYKLETENASLKAELAAAQAKIDRLMLEFCPEEMTEEQTDEWARSQQPAHFPFSADRVTHHKIEIAAPKPVAWVKYGVGVSPHFVPVVNGVVTFSCSVIESLEYKPLYAAPVVRPGYKLLKDTTHDERSWPEDSSHENGAYFCMCHHCGRQFTGYKRRVTCKVCAAVIAAAEGKK